MWYSAGLIRRLSYVRLRVRRNTGIRGWKTEL